MNPYYTHRPYLIDILDNLDYSKPIECLEFGIGYGSSEVFFKYAQTKENLRITAFETDRTWFDEISEKFRLENYNFRYIENWQNLDYLNFDKHYDFIFIDQAPWEERIRTLDSIGDCADIILLHDYDYFNKLINLFDIYDVSDVSAFGKYLKNFNLCAYKETLPPTLVFKNENR